MAGSAVVAAAVAVVASGVSKAAVITIPVRTELSLPTAIAAFVCSNKGSGSCGVGSGGGCVDNNSSGRIGGRGGRVGSSGGSSGSDHRD